MIAPMTIDYKVSPEIINAALYIKGGVTSKVNEMLANPSHSEIEAVWDHVTHHGDINPKKFVWGHLGKKWAKTIH